MDLTIQENKVSIGTVYNYTSINLYIFVKKNWNAPIFKELCFQYKVYSKKMISIVRYI